MTTRRDDDAAPARIGRPPKWTEGQLAVMRSVLLARVASGELVGKVAGELGVSRMEVWRWTQDSPAFRDDYARARECQAHALAEEALRIASEATADSAIADRLKLDAAKWYTSKIAPRVFGERIAVEQDATVRVVIEREATPSTVLERIARASDPLSLATPAEVLATPALGAGNDTGSTITATNEDQT